MVRIVVERAPQQRHHAIQRCRRDVAMTPDRIEQLIARDQLAGAREQHEQHAEGLRLERNLAGATGQPSIAIGARLSYGCYGECVSK